MFKGDVPKLKRKGERTHPPVVTKEDIVETSEDFQHKGRKIKLDIYIVYINGKRFLHSVDMTIKLKLLSAVGNQKQGDNLDKKLLQKEYTIS